MRQVTSASLCSGSLSAHTGRLRDVIFQSLSPGSEPLIAAAAALTLLGSSRELSLCASVVTLPEAQRYGRVSDVDDELATQGRLVASCLAALRGAAPLLVCDALQRSLNSDSPPQRVSAACALLVLLVSWRV